jgi:hypothetical protein
MAQPEGQTREPLSYQFQFVLCAHHGQSVDAAHHQLDQLSRFNVWEALHAV